MTQELKEKIARNAASVCQSFSITYEERQSLWDKEFKKYMEYPKEELVKMLIGRRP